MKTGDLLAKVEAIRGNAKKREPVQLPATPTALAKVVQLPLWPEPVRGVPNSVLRSALFGAAAGGSSA